MGSLGGTYDVVVNKINEITVKLGGSPSSSTSSKANVDATVSFEESKNVLIDIQSKIRLMTLALQNQIGIREHILLFL